MPPNSHPDPDKPKPPPSPRPAGTFEAGRTASPSLLNNFAAETERLSGMRTCFYDLSFFTADSPKLDVYYRSQSHTSPVCELMKSCPQGVLKCTATEDMKAKKAAKHRKGFFHTCYAGVTDYLFPIEIKSTHAGAIGIGQVVTSGGAELEQLKKSLAKQYKFSPREVSRAFSMMKMVDRKEVRQVARLTEVARIFIEQFETIATLGPEYQIFVDGSPKTAREAVESGSIPFWRLKLLRSKLAENDPIRKAVDLLEKRYSRNISHKEVAKEVGLSPSHLSRQFHRLTGGTFRKVLLETKLSAAFFLIKKYHVRISEAAYLVGYSDEVSFRRAFRKLLGMSPLAFMKKYPRAFDIIER